MEYLPNNPKNKPSLSKYSLSNILIEQIYQLFNKVACYKNTSYGLSEKKNSS